MAGEEELLTQHGRADVHADPVVTLFRDVIPAQPRATAGQRKGEKHKIMDTVRGRKGAAARPLVHPHRETLESRPRTPLGHPRLTPHMPPMCRDTGQGPRSPHIQQEARPVPGKSQQLHSPLRHLRLDLHHPGAARHGQAGQPAADPPPPPRGPQGRVSPPSSPPPSAR